MSASLSGHLIEGYWVLSVEVFEDSSKERKLRVINETRTVVVQSGLYLPITNQSASSAKLANAATESAKAASDSAQAASKTAESSQRLATVAENTLRETQFSNIFVAVAAFGSIGSASAAAVQIWRQQKSGQIDLIKSTFRNLNDMELNYNTIPDDFAWGTRRAGAFEALTSQLEWFAYLINSKNIKDKSLIEHFTPQIELWFQRYVVPAATDELPNMRALRARTQNR